MMPIGPLFTFDGSRKKRGNRGGGKRGGKVGGSDSRTLTLNHIRLSMPSIGTNSTCKRYYEDV